MMPLHAVLTGDLIKSRAAAADDVDRAMATLAATAALIDRMYDTATRFTRFRGDGWQIVLHQPMHCLAVAIQLFAALRATNLRLDTRMSIGIGSVTSLGSSDLSDADGPAFHISGDHLSRMGKRRIVVAGDPTDRVHDAVFGLVEAIMFGWTAAQADAVAHALSDRNMTHDDIAKTLGITRQAVQSRLASAQYAAVETAVAAYEDAVRPLTTDSAAGERSTRP